MSDILPAIAVYPVHHLPVIKAYADQLGLVGLINHYVPTEMEVDAGTVVLGLVLDTLSGRSPLYRLAEFFAHQDTELLLGKAFPHRPLPMIPWAVSLIASMTSARCGSLRPVPCVLLPDLALSAAMWPYTRETVTRCQLACTLP